MDFIENMVLLLILLIGFIGVLIASVFLDNFLQRNRRRIHGFLRWLK